MAKATWDEAEAPEEDEDTGVSYPEEAPQPGRLYDAATELDEDGAVKHDEDEALAADHTGTGAADQGG